jgi:Arc/MetJ-type ribon-helix-helix transcriptional regulator
MAEEMTAVQVRLNDSELEAIENWRRSQRKIPSRSEVMRILLQRALQAEKRERKEHAA